MSPPSGPSIRVVAGAGVNDTVLAQPAQALVFEVRGADARPAVGTVVRFESAAAPDTARLEERGVYVCALAEASCAGTFAHATVDSSGRVRVATRLGTVARPTWVIVSVPELSLRDSVRFNVRPGRPARVRVASRDTALLAGASYALRVTVADRFGNLAADPVIFTPSASDVDVTALGVVTARAPGRRAVYARAGTAVDTAFVSALPRGRIAVFHNGGTTGQAVITADLDGTGVRVLAPDFGSGLGAWPAWSANGDSVAFQGGYDRVKLYVVADALNATRRLLVPERDDVVQFHPRFSADGEWVYYNRGFTEVWRARPDGSAPEPVGQFRYNTFPAPSPDGALLAIPQELYDLRTRTSVSGLVPGFVPRWSPDGGWLAFAEDNGVGIGTPIGALAVVRRDGSGRRVLSAPGEVFIGGADWSPDGQWVIAYRGGPGPPTGLQLIRVSNGERLPLNLPTTWREAAWRPERPR